MEGRADRPTTVGVIGNPSSTIISDPPVAAAACIVRAADLHPAINFSNGQPKFGKGVEQVKQSIVGVPLSPVDYSASEMQNYLMASKQRHTNREMQQKSALSGEIRSSSNNTPSSNHQNQQQEI
ncbi:hypothetical protein ACLOJK_001532 [Asimina triloba]